MGIHCVADLRSTTVWAESSESWVDSVHWLDVGIVALMYLTAVGIILAVAHFTDDDRR